MFTKYLLTLLTQVTSWIGFSIILSVMFLPTSVTIIFALFLILTPDEKINGMVTNYLPKIKKVMEGK